MRKLLFIIIIIACWSCSESEAIKPGIWLSFDDRSIDQWFTFRKLLNENNVPVTFFITQPDSLSEEEVHKLKMLQQDGHEIGFHGNMHVSSEHYIQQNSYKEYLKNEIDDGLIKMNQLGFDPSVFAYPYGAKYWFTDLLLQSRFDFTRGVVPLNADKDISEMDDIYYKFDGDRSFHALSFDTNSDLTLEILEKGLARCVNEKEVLMLYAHTPSVDTQTGYSFKISTLEEIIRLAKKYDLTFYTTNRF